MHLATATVHPLHVPARTLLDLVGETEVEHPSLLTDAEIVQLPQSCDDVDPAARRTALTLARALAEVVTGRRPAMSLASYVTEDALGHVARAGRLERGRAPLVVASVRIQQPSDDGAEVTIRLTRGGRSSAVAMRLVREGSRWLCSDLVIGPIVA